MRFCISSVELQDCRKTASVHADAIHRLPRVPLRRIVVIATAEGHRMAGTFRIKLLPAQHGDCIWIEYGEPGSTHHVLVDGGPLGAFGALRAHVEALPAEARESSCWSSHTSTPTISTASSSCCGIPSSAQIPRSLVQRLAAARALACRRCLGLGGRRRSRCGQRRSARPHAGPRRTCLQRTLSADLPRSLPTTANCRARGSQGGLELTLLSPTPAKLAALRAAWLKTFAAARRGPGDEAFIGERLDRDARFRGGGAMPALPGGIDEAADAATTLDAAVANGSSIAFVAEYQGRRCAFLGDAHAPVVQQGLGRMARERGEEPLRLDAVKVSHHGSDGNTTTLLLQKLACRNFLISTNGSVFKHPDDAAIARIVKHAAPACLYFNYLSDYNRKWADNALQRQGNFQAVFPPEGAAGIELDLLATQ